MHPCAKPLVAVSLTVALVLAGATANATTSAISFKNQNVVSISDYIAPGFNDLFTFTTSDGSDRASAIDRFNDTNSSDGFSAFGLPDLSHGNSDNGKDSITRSGFDSGDHHIAGLHSDKDYGVDVFGIFNNPAGGFSYCGGLIVNPVPEPGEYALMLCGLGLISLVAIRRRHGHDLALT